MDHINISDLKARAIIGVDEWERKHKQDLVISIDLQVDLRDVCRTDELEDTVNYRSISKDVLRMVGKEKRHTIEALAGDVADLCLKKKGIHSVTVKVEKPDALRGAGSVGVKITRPLDE